MYAVKLDLADRKTLFRAAVAPNDLVSGHKDTRVDFGKSKGKNARIEPRVHFPDTHVVAVENGRVRACLRCENSFLSRRILGEGRIAIEMILAEIEQHRDPRTKLLHPLELKTADLQNGPIPLVGYAADKRHTEISAGKNLLTGRSENFSRQRGRGAFTVGTGDRDDGRLAKPISQFDLAQDRNPPSRCFLQQNILA